jgi:hypothetical protein
MKPAKLAFMLSLMFGLAGAENAQLAEPDRPIGYDGQPLGSPSTSGISEAQQAGSTIQTAGSSNVCEMIESAAAANDLPLEFFARVIWQESRLRPDAVGRMTRGGWRAQGIAQFMPLTAAERRLLDPFDPSQALPKSAEFLRELRAQFGNLGLAAAAYNAGPERVRDWLAGRRTLPSETRAYVRIVTGRSAEEWIRQEQKSLTVAIPRQMPCTDLTKLAAKSHSPARIAPHKPRSAWAIQLVGDRSESKALASFYQLQKKHKGILGGHHPVVIRTTLHKVSSIPIWNRVRIDADNREIAEALCSRLRMAGENCLVQRN